MKVSIGRIELIVGWKHVRSRKGRPASRTFCFVGTLGEQGLSKLNEVSVRRLSTDAPNPEKARKYSLEKLMKEAFPGRDNPNNLEIRTAIWKAYFSRPRKVNGRWIKDLKKNSTKESKDHPILS